MTGLDLTRPGETIINRRCDATNGSCLMLMAPFSIFERVESAALRQVFQLIGTAFDPVYLTEYRRINQTIWQEVERGEVKPTSVKVRRFELLLNTIGIAYSPDALSARYLECLAESPELIQGLQKCWRRCTGNTEWPF